MFLLFASQPRALSGKAAGTFERPASYDTRQILIFKLLFHVLYMFGVTPGENEICTFHSTENGVSVMFVVQGTLTLCLTDHCLPAFSA